MTRRIAVFVSGAGRSLLNLADRIAAGALDAEIVLVVSSSATAAGLAHARRLGLRAEVVAPGPGGWPREGSRRAFELADAARADLVVLAGFLKVVEVPDRFALRVLNIHPALLPSFGGKGMWGHHVHEAVLASGARVSGCTVHYVTAEVDGGPIVEQRVVEVRDDDDVDALAARVFEAEKEALPSAIALHLEGRLEVRGRRVVRREGGTGP